MDDRSLASGALLPLPLLRYPARNISCLAINSLLAAVCDHAENITITILLLRYPMHEPAFAQLASVFTITKLVLYASGLLLAIGGFLVRALKTVP